MATHDLEDRLESAIRHINTSIDIDPWAQSLAVESMRIRIAMLKTGQQEQIERLKRAMANTPVLLLPKEPQRKTGKWIDGKLDWHGIAMERYCSECGQLLTSAKTVYMNFCPNCGAKMEEGEK